MNLLLFDDSHPGCVIGLAPAAPAPERFAAEELQRCLAAATGGDFPIVETPDEPGFLLGSLGQSMGNTLPKLSEDGYLMKRVGERIVLLGGSPRATLYAVYHFLERYLGFGWLEPGDDAIPTLPEIVVGDIDDLEEPAYPFRSVVNFPFNPQRMRQEADWMVKNRLNWTHPGINGPHLWEEVNARETVMPEIVKRGLYMLWGGHTFQTWVPNDVYFDSHPEFFALVKSERRPQDNFGGSLCLSNAELQQEVARNILRFAAENPGISAVDLWMNDTIDWCECEECRQLEGEDDYGQYPEIFQIQDKPLKSRSYYAFVNNVARLVRAENRSLLLSPLAYYRSFEPPADLQLEPNVQVGFTNILCNHTLPLANTADPANVAHDNTIRRWRSHTENLYIYEYYDYPVSYNAFADELTTVAVMAEDLRYYPALGIRLCSTEGAGECTWRPLIMYAYARLLWNPDLSPAAIIEDFCRRAYADVAMQMIEFWQYHETGEPLATRQDKSLAMLRRAKDMTGVAEVRDRLTRLEKLLLTPGTSLVEYFKNLQEKAMQG